MDSFTLDYIKPDEDVSLPTSWYDDKLVQAAKDNRQKAEFLSELWSQYIPSVTLHADYFMMLLLDYHYHVIVAAICVTARKWTLQHRTGTFDDLFAILKESCSDTINTLKHWEMTVEDARASMGPFFNEDEDYAKIPTRVPQTRQVITMVKDDQKASEIIAYIQEHPGLPKWDVAKAVGGKRLRAGQQIDRLLANGVVSSHKGGKHSNAKLLYLTETCNPTTTVSDTVLQTNN